MSAAGAVSTLVLLGLVLGGLVARQVYRVIDSPREKTRRRLVGTRRTVIGELRAGTARVTGNVRRGRELLRAPISGRPCLAFEFRVEVSHGESWTEVVRGQKASPFMVADESGQAQVEPGHHFELVLAEDLRGGTGWMDHSPEPSHLAAVLA